MSEEIKPVVNETADVAKQEQEVKEAPIVEEVKDAVAAVADKAVEVVDSVKDAVEEVKEAAVNYGEKTLAELSELFQQLKASEDRMKRSKEAEALKSAFYKRLSREKAEAVCYLAYIVFCAAGSCDCSCAALIPDVNVMLRVESNYTASCCSAGGVYPHTFGQRCCQQSVRVSVTEIGF